MPQVPQLNTWPQRVAANGADHEEDEPDAEAQGFASAYSLKPVPAVNDMEHRAGSVAHVPANHATAETKPRYCSGVRVQDS